MPVKKNTKKKTTQKVKGSRNNANQNNINIKIGDYKKSSRKRSTYQPKPEQSRTTPNNIVVSVAPPSLQHIHPGYNFNEPVKQPILGSVQPVANPFVAPVSTPSFGQQAENTQTYHRNDNPHISSPSVRMDRVYNSNTPDFEDYYGSPFRVLDTITPLGEQKRNNSIAEIEAYDSVPQAFQTPHEATSTDIHLVRKEPNIDIKELKDYDQVPMQFQTPHEATTSKSMGKKLIQNATNKNVGGDEYEEYFNKDEDEIAEPKAVVKEQLISHPDDDKANKPPKRIIGKYDMNIIDESKGLDKMYEIYGNIEPYELNDSQLKYVKARDMLNEMFAYARRDDPNAFTVVYKVNAVKKAIKEGKFD